MISAPETSPVQSLDNLLETRARDGYAHLKANELVLNHDRIMDVSAARRATRFRRLGDLWRIIEAVFAISLVFGLGFAFHLLMGLFLK